MNENHQRVVYYAAKSGYYDAIKIGTTNNLARRLKSLRSKYGEDFEFIVVEFDHGNPLHFSLESQRHREFRDCRIVGEWFWNTPELEQHIWSLDRDLLGVLLP